MTRDDYMIGQVNVVANGLFQLVLILGKNNPALQAELAAAMQKMEAERVALNTMLKRSQEAAALIHAERFPEVTARVNVESAVGSGCLGKEPPSEQM